MPDLKRTFGAHMRQTRKARGLTQEKLAELCELSLDMVGRLERGAIAPSFDSIERICDALAASPASLFGGKPIIQAENPERERAFSRILNRLAPLNDQDLEWVDRILTAVLRR